jgi:hypothetical protein
MESYLTPHRVAEDPANAEFCAIENLMQGGAFPVSHFAALLLPKAERADNWPQTFARKGLNSQHYWYETEGSSPMEYRWRRHRTAGHLPIPETVVFERSGDPTATLQGDVVTYVRQELGLYLEGCAKRINSCLGAKGLRELGFEKAERGFRYLAGPGLLARVLPYVNGKVKARFETEVVDCWDQRRCFLVVCIQ